MRWEYLIDGYNLIRTRPVGQLPRGKGSLQKERDALLRWISPRLADNERATVVFDASSPAAQLAPRAKPIQFGIEVIFAESHETADELILELCREHTHPKQLIVVTNDREIQRVIKRRKARPMACDHFMYHLATQARRRARAKRQRPEKPTTVTDEEMQFLTEQFQADLPTSVPGDLFEFYDDMNLDEDSQE